MKHNTLQGKAYAIIDRQGFVINMCFTQKELADMLSTSETTVSNRMRERKIDCQNLVDELEENGDLVSEVILFTHRQRIIVRA